MLNRLVIGGAPLNTVQLAGYLSHKHDVYLLVGQKNDDEIDASFLVKNYPALKIVYHSELKRTINVFRDLQELFRIRRFLKKTKPHIVHTNGAKPGFLGRLAATSTGVPIILHTYHGHVFHSYFNKFISSLIVIAERWIARHSTRIIAISNTQKEELVNKYHICNNEKIQVVPLGINTELFSKDEPLLRKRFREKYELEEHEIAIGLVGRIVPVKGHTFFLNIIKEIMTGTHKPVRFFIIGDGILREKLQDMLRESQISSTYFPNQPYKASVIFTSWILNIEEAMAGLDIVALSSLNEGTPITLMEAQAAGNPVVSTNAGAVNEVVQNNVTGFISQYGDTETFSNNLLQLINDAELRKKMGSEGRIFAQNNFSKEKELGTMDALYNELLGNTIT